MDLSNSQSLRACARERERRTDRERETETERQTERDTHTEKGITERATRKGAETIIIRGTALRIVSGPLGLVTGSLRTYGNAKKSR